MRSLKMVSELITSVEVIKDEDDQERRWAEIKWKSPNLSSLESKYLI